MAGASFPVTSFGGCIPGSGPERTPVLPGPSASKIQKCTRIPILIRTTREISTIDGGYLPRGANEDGNARAFLNFTRRRPREHRGSLRAAARNATTEARDWKGRARHIELRAAKRIDFPRHTCL